MQQVKYVFSSDWIQNKSQVILLCITLMNAQDPELEEMKIDDEDYTKQQLRTYMQDQSRVEYFITTLQNAQQITYAGYSQETGTLYVHMQLASKVQVSVEGNATLEQFQRFEREIRSALVQLYPDTFEEEVDEAHRLIQASVVVSRGSVILDKQLILNGELTYELLQKSYLKDRLMKHSSKENVMVKVPVSLWRREWVLSMYFTDRLELANLRLIMPGKDGIAKYTDLDSNTEREAFDQAVTILKKQVSEDGKRSSNDELVWYGFEDRNMMIVDDLKEHCVSLVISYK